MSWIQDTLVLSVLHLHEGVKTSDKVDGVLVANEQGFYRLDVLTKTSE